jgi:hypothetical protein
MIVHPGMSMRRACGTRSTRSCLPYYGASAHISAAAALLHCPVAGQARSSGSSDEVISRQGLPKARPASPRYFVPITATWHPAYSFRSRKAASLLRGWPRAPAARRTTKHPGVSQSSAERAHGPVPATIGPCREHRLTSPEGRGAGELHGHSPVDTGCPRGPVGAAQANTALRNRRQPPRAQSRPALRCAPGTPARRAP